MNNWHNYTDNHALVAELSNAVITQLQRAIDERGAAALAVSGGNTPIPLFQYLSMQDIDWQRVTIVLVDERWVPLSHADSNESMVQQNLLQNNAATAAFIGLKSCDEFVEDGVALCAQRLSSLTSPFAAVVLGMGTDGHTASWFVGANEYLAAIDPHTASPVCAMHPPAAPNPRMTLTLPRILHSDAIFVHIVGDEKRRVYETAVNRELPIAHIIRQQQTPVDVYWAAE